jgi:RNA polymerase sigma factor (sigma-70 family)
MAHFANAHLADIVRGAADGDEDAWRHLVARFTPALRRAARGFRLTPDDIDDVLQVTWSRAFCQIRRLREPEAIGAWLVVTARRESLRHLQRSVPEILTDDPGDERADHHSPEVQILAAERRAAVRRAIDRLPAHQRRLLYAQLATPGCTYEELSEALGIPIGSIGPTRIRGIDRLRTDRELTAAVTA